MKNLVVALDGPSYVGKSCIAQHLARLLDCLYINTGHMYRAVARLCMEKGILSEQRENVLALARTAHLAFEGAGEGRCRTLVNGLDWTEALDKSEIVLYASKIAVLPALRDLFTDLQRSYAKKQSIVMEGRDIGSVILPDADWKFFVTASEEVRAKRMLKMMKAEERAQWGSYQELIPKIRELDERDTKRTVAPLKQAEDAIVYDNSDSPDALQDAHILYYYVTHTQELLRNADILQAHASKK